MPLPLSFVDTNLFIYTADKIDPARHAIALTLIDTLNADDALMVSTQVLNEVYFNLIKPKARSGRPPLPPLSAQKFVRSMETMSTRIVLLTPFVCHRGYELNDRHRMHFWDALMLSAAIEGGAKQLYTEDMPGAVDPKTGLLEGVRYVNPFVPIAGAGIP